jgi:hypothetical protein
MAKKADPPEDLEEEIDALEKRIERLRILYEQFFIGIEKRPPLMLQRDVVRRIRQIGNYHIRQTHLKFRYSSLVQRFNVHRAVWMRTTREIEEGTYRRDRIRVIRRERARSGEAIDNAELAKRVLLREFKGDKAVHRRRRRQAMEGEDDGSVAAAHVPAVARRLRRRREDKKGVRPTDIRGASPEEIRARQAALEAGDVEDTVETPMLSAEQLQAFISESGGADAVPTPTPEATRFPGPSHNGPRDATARSGQQPAAPRPTAAGPEPPPRRPPATPPPAAGPAGGRPQDSTVSVLTRAGLSPERVAAIYEGFIRARQQAGQSVSRLSYERVVESLARQVPRAQDRLNTSEVDFAVVTRDGKVYLKPIPK